MGATEIMFKNLYVLLLGLLLVSTLVVVGVYYSSASGPNGPFRSDILKEVAKAFLQLAVIGILGAVVKYAFDRRADDQAKTTAENNFRRQMLEKLLGTYRELRKVRSYIEAHQSAKTYGEQMRVIIDVRLDLSEISHAIDTAKGVFKKAEDIKAAVSLMEEYLKELILEFESRYKGLSETQRRTPELIGQKLAELKTLTDFRKGEEGSEYKKKFLPNYRDARDRMRKEYWDALQKSA